MFFFPRFGSALVWLLWGFPTILVLWSRVPWSSHPLVLWSRGPLVPWSSGPLVLWSPGSSGLSILWSLVAVFGRMEILPITAYGASEKIGLQKNNDICGFESLRLLRSQETANTVFADPEATHVANYSIVSSWKIRNVLSSRICALWENRHTANNSYLAMQTHCKTERSKGCKRLRVLIVVPVLQKALVY